MSKHKDFLSRVIAGATQVGVFEERLLDCVVRSGLVALVGEDGRDALASEGADFEGADRNRLRASQLDATIKAEDSKAGAEALFGMRPAGERRDDQPFGVWPDLAGPAAEPIRGPIGVTPM